MKKQNEISVILGKKGSGKTSLAFHLIEGANRLIIFDFNREYSGFYVVREPDELAKVLQINFEGTFRISYQPSPNLELVEHFEHLCAAVFCMNNVTVLAEEIDIVSTASYSPPSLKKIIDYGRHRGINLLGLSRRAHRVPRDLTANADKIYTFAQFEPRDIKYLADYMGERAAEQVTNLNRTAAGAEFLEWEAGETRKGFVNFVDKAVTFQEDRVTNKSDKIPADESD